MDKRVAQLFDLTGRVALVTGGSSGIGRAVAWALAAAGARTVLVARRETELREVVREFAQDGFLAAAVPCDITKRAEIAAACTKAAGYFGAPDILVNAAGVNLRAPFAEVSDEDWDTTIEINLTAPFMLTRALAPAMRERGWGRIINIASLQSVRAFANSAAYGASKGGLMQFTRAAAEYWSKFGVTCNAIAPGLFPTPLTKAVFADPEAAEAMAQRTMIRRNGELPDLYGTAIFLASNASRFVTGQTLFVDGGLTAG
jgi:gluconate 5-dehydrogenase